MSSLRPMTFLKHCSTRLAVDSESPLKCRNKRCGLRARDFRCRWRSPARNKYAGLPILSDHLIPRFLHQPPLTILTYGTLPKIYDEASKHDRGTWQPHSLKSSSHPRCRLCLRRHLRRDQPPRICTRESKTVGVSRPRFQRHKKFSWR